MEKLEGLGRRISKAEQKQIIGGSLIVVCTCDGSDLDTTVCSASTFKGFINCLSAASSYCTDNGYTSTSCNAGPQA